MFFDNSTFLSAPNSAENTVYCLHLCSTFLAASQYPRKLYKGLSFTQSLKHKWVAVTMQGAANWVNLGLRVLPKYTTKDKEGAGFEPPTLWLIDNPLDLLYQN